MSRQDTANRETMMPFVEIYRVDFAGGNLHPSLNTLGWPDMIYSLPTPADLAARVSDAEGITLSITRSITVPTGTFAFNSVYVVPGAPGLSLDSRLLMRLTFDRPFAEGLPTGDRGPFPTELEPPSREGRPTAIQQTGRASVLNAGSDHLTAPEPWAVVLNVSGDGAIHGARMVNVTCQFNRERNGIRLNTPGALQAGPGPNLESPLDYGKYQGGYVALPDNTDGVVAFPLFSLAHSFCGFGAASTQHTPGAGFLKIERTYQPLVLRDHRVYSANAIAGIGALGVSLVTQTGMGKIRVRVRTFSILVSR